VIGGHGVGDRHAGVGPVHGEALVADRVHQRDHVAGEGAGKVSVNPCGRFGAPETEPGPSGMGRLVEAALMRLRFHVEHGRLSE
jgi:hypothetical protein